MITIIFYILATITLGTAALTVLSKHPVHSAVYMIVCFFTIAGHFLMLNAQFLSVVHIIVYTGAIMILLLFTLMLMNLNEEHEPKKSVASRIAAVTAACLTGLVLLAVSIKANTMMETYNVENIDYQSVKVIGQVLLEEYLVPFEFASILLIASMIGAVLISKREKKA
ncbi:MAG: hypothetical protein RL662_490 [Bacteroidota bacterium]|jgi:NADH-quinone oxidoreductase subunit J